MCRSKGPVGKRCRKILMCGIDRRAEESDPRHDITNNLEIRQVLELILVHLGAWHLHGAISEQLINDRGTTAQKEPYLRQPRPLYL